MEELLKIKSLISLLPCPMFKRTVDEWIQVFNDKQYYPYFFQSISIEIKVLEDLLKGSLTESKTQKDKKLNISKIRKLFKSMQEKLNYFVSDYSEFIYDKNIKDEDKRGVKNPKYIKVHNDRKWRFKSYIHTSS